MLQNFNLFENKNYEVSVPVPSLSMTVKCPVRGDGDEPPTQAWNGMKPEQRGNSRIKNNHPAVPDEIEREVYDMSYYLHRIQRAGNNYEKGIEVHETLDSALLAYWGRMKTGYGKSDNDFVSCKITDDSGNVVKGETWLQEGEQGENKYFLHHIRKTGETHDKNIDILDSIDAAKGDFAVQMEYGYNNPKQQNVSFVSCYITDLLSGGMVLMQETWAKPQPEPEPAE